MTRSRRGRAAARILVGVVAVVALLLPFVPAGLAAPSGTVSGVLVVPATLTPAAVAVVTIYDQGAAATEPIIVGQQRTPASGFAPAAGSSPAAGSMSIPFTVRYDPARINPARPYVLYAAIVDGTATYLNSDPVPVITGGPESGLSVPMVLRPDGPATLKVIVVKKDKTALTANAVVQAGVAKVGSGRIASQDLAVSTAQAAVQPPVTLEIPYDPALVDPTAQYVMKAAIVDGGSVWETLVAVPVVPGSTDPVTVEVTLLPVKLPTVPASPAPSVAPTAAPTATPVPTATPKPTAAPTATPKPTAVPTATPAPTAAPTSTPTPAPTPTPTPASTAPTPSASTSPSASATAAPTATPTPAPSSGTVSGTLVYPEPAKLSGGAKAVVALLDEGNGASVAVVTSDVIETPGQQPVAFTLQYATSSIDPAKTYTIRAAIIDGSNAWASAKGVPVITKGAPASGVVVPLTYQPDLLLGDVTGTLTGVDGTLGSGASSVTMVVDPTTGTVLGVDARPQAGASGPIPFSVPFNVADVKADAPYVVTGEVTDGQRSWQTTTPPRVITGGNPFSGVTVPLAAVPTATPAPTPTPTPAVTPAPVPEGNSSSSGPSWLLPLLLVVVVGGIAAVVYARRRTPPSA